eukprot:TRINITY_DN7324_c0_g1_i1.p1 TRINITY_DN7324_c0_g1~~TRINITY_DN7324_c0_g1_i1.p1  ORF type:complete len:512 (-),score=122.57 TRINITY_DN7324_c0_g1_i1:641-2176(-)
MKAIKRGVRRQIVSLPVASGKTVIFANLIKRIKPPNPKATRTLVLAHREELIHQAVRIIGIYNPGVKISIEQGINVAEEQAEIVVASVQSIGRENSSRLLKYDPSEFKLVIIDEAHHASATTYRRVIDHFLQPTNKQQEISSHGVNSFFGRTKDNVIPSTVQSIISNDNQCILWGCTATAKRSDGIGLSSAFQELTYHIPLEELMKQGWLAPLRGQIIRTNTSLEDISTTSEDFILAVLSQRINTTVRNQQIVDEWMRLAKDRKSTLAFAADVQHVLDMVATFEKCGIEAKYVTAETPSDIRAQIVSDFKAGNFPVLVNCGVFTEGTDLPNVDCVIMGRPTRSWVLFQQMLGRGLRRFENKLDCLVLDVVDNFGSNSIVTLPCVFGLPPDFDFKGMNASEACSEMQHLFMKNINTIHCRSVDDARLASLHSSSIDYTEDPEIQHITDLQWLKVGDQRWFLPLKPSTIPATLTIKPTGRRYVARLHNESKKKTHNRSYNCRRGVASAVFSFL